MLALVQLAKSYHSLPKTLLLLLLLLKYFGLFAMFIITNQSKGLLILPSLLGIPEILNGFINSLHVFLVLKVFSL